MRAGIAVIAWSVATLSGIPASATAATPERALTVRGAGNTYADITLATAVRLSTSTAARTPPRFTTSGSYAAVYVEPVGRAAPGAGTVLLNGLAGWEDVPFALGPPATWLPPGRYRVHLLGDGGGSVRVEAQGLRRDVTVTTTRPSNVAGGFLDRDVAGASLPADRTVVPLTIRPNTLTIVASQQRSTAFYGRRDVCVRSGTDPLSPCVEGNAGRGWYWGVTPIEWTVAGAAVYSPGELPNGPAEVEFVDATVGVPHDVHRFVLTVNG